MLTLSAAGRTLNLNISTADGVHLGAWLTLAERHYQQAALHTPGATADVRAALAAHPTVLFLHGNAASRAALHRPAAAGLYSTRLAANVLALDYRGFGDSGGAPTELGVRADARAAWDWLVASTLR